MEDNSPQQPSSNDDKSAELASSSSSIQSEQEQQEKDVELALTSSDESELSLTEKRNVLTMKPPPLLRFVGAYSVSPYIQLFVMRGSVVDFGRDSWFDQFPETAAIVNAANEGCLGGGGVDGAIVRAGGPRLARARQALPRLSLYVRCRTGQSVLTGPNVYGDLKVSYIIHSVGPNYYDYNRQETSKGHELLRSAYQSALDLAHEHRIQHVGFSLLSSGIFKGPFLSLENVLEVGLEGIEAWKPTDSETDDKIITDNDMSIDKNDKIDNGDTNDNSNDVKEKKKEESKPSSSSFPRVYLCGFTDIECRTLLQLCDKKFEKLDSKKPDSSDSE